MAHFPMTTFEIFAGLLGAAVGSFLNVCIWRLPREGLRLSSPPRSFCPSCGTAIRWQDNIPVWGWLRLGGRCRDCRSPISPRYPAVELLTACLYLVLAWRYLDPTAAAPFAFLVAAVLVAATLAGAFIDIELRIIPNEITLRGMMLAPGAVLLAPEILRVSQTSAVPRFLGSLEPRLEGFAAHLPGLLRDGAGPWIAALAVAVGAFFCGCRGHAAYRRWRAPGESQSPRDGLLAGTLLGWGAGMAALHLVQPASLAWPRTHAFWVGALGMATGAGLVQAVGLLGTRVFRKPAMGFGDVKLMGLLGAFTGPLACVEAFFIACFLGSVIGGYYWIRYRDRYIPFGPFLTAGALLMILWPEGFEAVVKWYLGFFR